MAIKIINQNSSNNKLQTKIKQKNSFSLNFLKKEKFSAKKKTIFYSDLSILFSSGIDLVECLSMIEDNFNKASDKQLIKNLSESIVSGLTLSEAMNKTGKFSPYEFYSIEIGEETGSLQSVIKNLHEYFKRYIEQRRKLLSSLSYPVMVLLTAFAAVTFMLGFVVPMFEDIFRRYGKELPWITQTVIDMSDYLTNNWYIIIFTVFLIVVLFSYALKQKKVSQYLSLLVLKIPLLGDMIKQTFLLRFFTAFELLVRAHTPLISSLELLAKMINFYPIKQTLPLMKTDILKGESLTDSMKKHGIYGKKVITLINIYEHINKLEIAFEQLKLQYTEDINHKSNIIGNIMEPVLIILVGLIVGLILISMYLPIFEFSSSIGM